MNTTLVRCHCCGEWLNVLGWNNKKPTYCEGCSVGRTGNGKGQCEYCVEYPQNLRHWDDLKPENVPYIHVYIR